MYFNIAVGEKKSPTQLTGFVKAAFSAFSLLWPSHTIPLLVRLCLPIFSHLLPPHFSPGSTVRTKLPKAGTLPSADLPFLTLLPAREIIKACFWFLMGLFSQLRQWFTSTPLPLCGRAAATSRPLLGYSRQVSLSSYRYSGRVISFKNIVLIFLSCKRDYSILRN